MIIIQVANQFDVLVDVIDQALGRLAVGAVVGMTHAVATRGVFGTIGSGIVSVLLVIDGMGFYLFTVAFIIVIATALLGTIPAVAIVTAAVAFVMIVNNYFGFTGLQRFAQYVAVPVIVVWGVYATLRALTSVSADQLAAVPAGGASVSIIFVAGGMVGLSTWGNEPDIFRYAKAGRASLWCRNHPTKTSTSLLRHIHTGNRVNPESACAGPESLLRPRSRCWWEASSPCATRAGRTTRRRWPPRPGWLRYTTSGAAPRRRRATGGGR